VVTQTNRIRVEWVGRSPAIERELAARTRASFVGAYRRVDLGVGAGGVSVATSGWVAPVIVVGILALAIYGGVKAVGKLPAGR
jgi:hypothetical protein